MTRVKLALYSYSNRSIHLLVPLWQHERLLCQMFALHATCLVANVKWGELCIIFTVIMPIVKISVTSLGWVRSNSLNSDVWLAQLIYTVDRSTVDRNNRKEKCSLQIFGPKFVVKRAAKDIWLQNNLSFQYLLWSHSLHMSALITHHTLFLSLWGSHDIAN